MSANRFVSERLHALNLVDFWGQWKLFKNHHFFSNFVKYTGERTQWYTVTQDVGPKGAKLLTGVKPMCETPFL